MGGDGQSVVNKRSILENSKIYVSTDQLKTECDEGQLELSKKERVGQQWTYCALSYDPLEMPVVFDLRGRLCSKKSVIDGILARRSHAFSQETPSGEQRSIMKLGDVCEIQNAEDKGKVEIRCPVTGFEASSGLHKFVGFWGCGHVLCNSSDPSLKPEEKSLESLIPCPYCGELSFPVMLAFERKSDEEKQQKNLRPLLRAFRKRKRTEE